MWKQELCANEWRPSRLEAECVQGDGLILSFPTIECSPLIGHQLGSYDIMFILCTALRLCILTEVTIKTQTCDSCVL